MSNHLKHLRPQEAADVLHRLIKARPDIRAQAEEIAAEVISPPPVEDIAHHLFLDLREIPLENIGQRSGGHRHGYVEPTEAACSLLEEGIQPYRDDLDRNLALGLAQHAEAVAAGTIRGLHRAFHEPGDGPLAWCPDLPLEEACEVMKSLIKGHPGGEHQDILLRVMKNVGQVDHEWGSCLEMAARRARTRTRRKAT